MFGKKRNRLPGIDTLVGKGTRVDGDVHFCSGFHIDGHIIGNLTADDGSGALISISEHGCVEGIIKSPYVILHGTVKGDVIATEKITFGTRARVIGNVYYELIEMAIGAEVNGQMIHQPASKVRLVSQNEDKNVTENTNLGNMPRSS